jgi:hypothetical protein
MLVPLSSEDALLGVLVVSVLERPHRLRPSPDLRRRRPRSRTAAWSTRSPIRRFTTN